MLIQTEVLVGVIVVMDVTEEVIMSESMLKWLIMDLGVDKMSLSTDKNVMMDDVTVVTLMILTGKELNRHNISRIMLCSSNIPFSHRRTLHINWQ